MRIQFSRSGGFAGLRLSLDLGPGDLPPALLAELERLVADALFFELPQEFRAPPGSADRFVYRLSVEQTGREHSVEVSEAAVPDTLRPLLRRLTELAGERRRG